MEELQERQTLFEKAILTYPNRVYEPGDLFPHLVGRALSKIDTSKYKLKVSGFNEPQFDPKKLKSNGAEIVAYQGDYGNTLTLGPFKNAPISEMQGILWGKFINTVYWPSWEKLIGHSDNTFYYELNGEILSFADSVMAELGNTYFYVQHCSDFNKPFSDAVQEMQNPAGVKTASNEDPCHKATYEHPNGVKEIAPCVIENASTSIHDYNHDRYGPRYAMLRVFGPENPKKEHVEWGAKRILEFHRRLMPKLNPRRVARL